MRILILNWRDVKHPKSGGAEIVTLEHAKFWASRGHTVVWVTSSYDGAPKEEKVGGVTILHMGGSFTIYLYVMVYLLLHGRSYSVIVDEVHGLPFFTPLLTRVPHVVFIHEVAGDIWDYMWFFPVNVIGKMMETLYFFIYRHCLFWTDAPSMVEEIVARGIPKSQCWAIPCPIHVPRTLPIPKEKEPTYIFVSRVVKMKGIEEVVKAFSFIQREQTRAKLWIVGGGEESYTKQLLSMTEEYGVAGNVFLFGKVTQVRKYELMRRAHILLHASVKEGWGLVILEAASQGTPSVVYNVPGLRDVVQNGKSGIIVPDNSPHEMATLAIRLYNDKRRYRHIEKEGLRWVKQLHWTDVTTQSLALLKKAMKK